MLDKIIAAIVAAVPILRKKPYCVWYLKEGIWCCNNPKGNSFRRCKKGAAVLLGLGFKGSEIIIMPLGMMPIYNEPKDSIGE